MSKDIWHLPPETPDVFRAWQVLVIYEAGDQREFMASNEFSWRTANRYVNRWCYVDKLVADYDRTRKALDVAVDALKEIKDGKIPVSLGIYMDINDALEQITALEQKDVK